LTPERRRPAGAQIAAVLQDAWREEAVEAPTGADWGEAERVVANIAALYREFRGDTTGPVASEVLGQMAQLTSEAGPHASCSAPP
jgi:hypothetical protein